MATAAELVYGEAVRAIEEQLSNLDGLRVRTGTLLAAVSLITAFLGAQAIAHHGGTSLGPAGGVAVAFFVATAVGCLVVLWPWTWSFVVSPAMLIEDHLEEGAPSAADDLALYLARVHEQNWNGNVGRLEVLFWVFRGATLCLAGEVIAWLIALTLV